MDWYKVKSILILSLLILNITFFTMFYHTTTQDNIIENQSKENVVSILKNNNIIIDKKTIPDSPTSFTSRYISRATSDNISFISGLLGDDFSYDRNLSLYKSGTKTLKINGDIFDYTDSGPNLPLEKDDEEYIKDYCIQVMKNLGMDYRLYKFSGFNYGLEKLKAIFTPKLGDYEFFDSYISFELNKNGITSMSAKNIIIDKAASSISSKVFNVNSILLDLPLNPQLAKSQINKIISVRLGYYIGSNEQKYSNVLAIPVFQIVTENGIILHYDARGGNFIE